MHGPILLRTDVRPTTRDVARNTNAFISSSMIGSHWHELYSTYDKGRMIIVPLASSYVLVMLTCAAQYFLYTPRVSNITFYLDGHVVMKYQIIDDASRVAAMITP